MSDHQHDSEVAVLDDPRFPAPDPGLEPEPERYTDADPGAGNAAYRFVVASFAVVPLLAIAFVVIYFAVPRTLYIDFGGHYMAQHVLLGLCLGLALFAIGIGCIQWARQLMTDHEITEERHGAASSEETRREAVEIVRTGIDESAITRRKLIGRSLLGALGIIAIPGVVLLADMGPWPTKGRRAATIERTIWAEGVRLVSDVSYRPIRAADMEIGQLVNGEPETLVPLEGTHDFLVEKAKSAIIVVRMDPNEITIPESRKDWHVNGILCYSKICTHVGCPISLWEQQTHHLLCPCHQSTFDLGNSGVVVFGPAARSLPQLPIHVDSEGYLVATSDFTVPVGPSFFERDSRHDFKDGDN